jgi:xanthine dehydrogenase molybdopterin-binding subunit B
VFAAAVGGVNECGSFPGDEEVFAANEVKCVGQSIGLIVADTPQHAREAAKKVRVEYEKAVDAPILEIRDAIAKKSFLVCAIGLPGMGATVWYRE